MGEFVLSFLFCFVAKLSLMLTLGLRAGTATCPRTAIGRLCSTWRLLAPRL
jgi:hypothetical protein